MLTVTVSVMKLLVVFSAFDLTELTDEKQPLLSSVTGSLSP